MTNFKSYSELIQYESYEDRLRYLMCYGSVASDTFGFDRFLNQQLYRSEEWKQLRNQIILRDKGCDLGVDGYDIFEKPVIHHINPITVEDLKDHSSIVFDPNNLITTTLFTHNLIHYGRQEQALNRAPVERRVNDTCPWRN